MNNKDDQEQINVLKKKLKSLNHELTAKIMKKGINKLVMEAYLKNQFIDAPAKEKKLGQNKKKHK